MGHAGNISALQDKLNGTYPKIHHFQKVCVPSLDTHRMNQPLQENEKKERITTLFIINERRNIRSQLYSSLMNGEIYEVLEFDNRHIN